MLAELDSEQRAGEGYYKIYAKPRTLLYWFNTVRHLEVVHLKKLAFYYKSRPKYIYLLSANNFNNICLMCSEDENDYLLINFSESMW